MRKGTYVHDGNIGVSHGMCREAQVAEMSRSWTRAMGRGNERLRVHMISRGCSQPRVMQIDKGLRVLGAAEGNGPQLELDMANAKGGWDGGVE